MERYTSIADFRSDLARRSTADQHNLTRLLTLVNLHSEAHRMRADQRNELDRQLRHEGGITSVRAQITSIRAVVAERDRILAVTWDVMDPEFIDPEDDLIAQARTWLIDTIPDNPSVNMTTEEIVNEMSVASVRRCVDKSYEGGWAAFFRSTVA